MHKLEMNSWKRRAPVIKASELLTLKTFKSAPYDGSASSRHAEPSPCRLTMPASSEETAYDVPSNDISSSDDPIGRAK